MKMKNVLSLRSLSIAVIAGIVMVSCKKTDENPLNSSDSQNVNSESVADAATNEVADMGNSIVVNVTPTQYGGSRVAGDVLKDMDKKDGRLAGATITITRGIGSTKDNPSGTITIDYGTTGVTTNGVTRKGIITITYSGKKNVATAYRTMSFTNYSRNGVAFDNAMSYKVTNVQDSTKFHHVLTGGKLTFPDQTTITRATDFMITINYTAKTVTLSATDGTQNTINGHSAKGSTREGKEYTMDITAGIVYKAECLSTTVIPVQGTKTITAGLLSYTIDYGTGTCDNTITITIAGKTVTITASADGH
ncbi:hypothetical protein WSM22_32160 [Cytophagales bacterium WSM2-2]|nr:hypothetical protein WSM22_32160 [Cytophagales bacterium WSM2-2]